MPITKPSHGATGNWDDATNAAIDWINANDTLPGRVGTLESQVGSEGIDDRVAALLQAGANVTLTYDDNANSLTIAATMNAESIDDRVAALLVAGNGMTLTYDDTANTLTITANAPVGAAGGVLSGTYPNPGFAVDMATQSELDTVSTAKANTASPTFTGTATFSRTVSTPVAVSFANPLTVDAAAGTRFRTTATSDFTLNPPTNPVDGQQIALMVTAQTSTRTMTVSGSIALTTGLTASVAIVAGKTWVGGLLYDNGGWVLVASTQTI